LPPSSIVDTHAHIISSDPRRYPHAPLGGSLPEWLSERSVDAQQLLERMPRAGVDQAVLVQYSSAHGYDNDYVLDTAVRHADRFVAVCTLDGLRPEAADQLTVLVNDRGAAGVRIRAARRDGPLDWLRCEPLWQRAGDLGVPVAVHFMESSQAEGLSLLPALLEQFPRVRVVLDHVANPPWREGPPDYGLGPVLDLARYDQLYLKFATINLERLEAAGVEPQPILGRLIQSFTARRIMWGSDAPNTPGDYAEMVLWMCAALSDVSDEDQRWIWADTARSVYPRLDHQEK
jgi:predicted TIM-barrel fold metal-dependent hydrolase